jgi:twinkle protein
MTTKLTHQPCPNPECGSSDAATLWPDKGTFHCHSCKQSGKVKSDVGDLSSTTNTDEGARSVLDNNVSSLPVPFPTKPYRSVEVKTLNQWGIKGPDEKGHWYFPLYIKGSEVNFKVNQPEVENKKYTYLKSGFKQTDYDLFGSHVPPKSTKAVTIVEGMWDAPSLSQMLGGYPVVAPCNSTTAVECIQKNFEYLNQFDTIKLLFDNDKAGDAIDKQKIASLFPGKVEVVEVPSDFPKDPNEALTKGQSQELVKRWWNSTPVKLKAFADLEVLKEDIFNNTSLDFHPFPWERLNKEVWGWLYGSLDVIIAGSSIGKSIFMTEVSRHILKTMPDAHQLVFFMEDTKKKAGLRYMGLESGIPFHNPGEEFSEKERDEAWDKTLGTNKIHLFDFNKYGTVDTKSVLTLIELAYHVYGCRIVILDHISYILSGMGPDNTLVLTQQFITELSQLAVRLDIYILAACHLRKNSAGKAWEQGAVPTMEDMYGSSAMYQYPTNIFSLARNKMAEDINARNITGLHVNKARESGYSGHVSDIKYSLRPYKLTEIERTIEEDN